MSERQTADCFPDTLNDNSSMNDSKSKNPNLPVTVEFRGQFVLDDSAIKNLVDVLAQLVPQSDRKQPPRETDPGVDRERYLAVSYRDARGRTEVISTKCSASSLMANQASPKLKLIEDRLFYGGSPVDSMRGYPFAVVSALTGKSRTTLWRARKLGKLKVGPNGLVAPECLREYVEGIS